jgi:hypothetical protein
MDVVIAEQKAYIFNDQLNDQAARERAIEKKVDVFGTVAKFLQRPRTEEIQITYSEKRYEPFWYVAAHATYIFERTQRYRIPITDPSVKTITITGADYTPQKEKEASALVLQGLEHCEDIFEKHFYLDGVSSEKKDYSQYMKFPTSDIADLNTFAPDHAIVVPPQVRIAQVVRELIQSMMKAVQADRIQQETVEITNVGLYFHPIFAFEYHWTSKDTKKVVEFDGLTGAMRAEGKAIHQQIRKVIDNDLLFDLSAEAVNLVVPGGAIAIKLVRAAAQRAGGGARPA